MRPDTRPTRTGSPPIGPAGLFTPECGVGFVINPKWQRYRPPGQVSVRSPLFYRVPGESRTHSASAVGSSACSGPGRSVVHIEL